MYTGVCMGSGTSKAGRVGCLPQATGAPGQTRGPGADPADGGTSDGAPRGRLGRWAPASAPCRAPGAGPAARARVRAKWSMVWTVSDEAGHKMPQFARAPSQLGGCRHLVTTSKLLEKLGRCHIW